MKATKQRYIVVLEVAADEYTTVDADDVRSALEGWAENFEEDVRIVSVTPGREG